MGVGVAARYDPEVDTVLDLGEGHPSGHGMFRLRLRTCGEHIVSAEPIVGFLHRGAEKLYEVRDYRQVILLADRHDWLASFGSELGVALAAESLLGLEVPERAVWLRTLFAELNRVLAHLTFLGTFPLHRDPLADLRPQREELYRLLEAATGNRVHAMANRVGGLAGDVPRGWLGEVRNLEAVLAPTFDLLRKRLASAEVVDTARGVGVLTAATAAAYGVTGPTARGGGLDLDLRRDDPYLGYGDLFAPGGPGRVVTRRDGDVLARLEVLLEQLEVSTALLGACVDRLRSLPPGPVGVRLPKVLRVPEGDVYCATENPPGTNGYFLVSRGEPTPFRLKLRSASFNNLAALSAVLPGNRVADLAAALASFFFVIGDVDK